MYPAPTAGRPYLPAAAAEAVSVIALLVTLAWAVARPRGWPEAVVAVPAAAVVVAAGALPAAAAVAEARRLGPVIGFLAAILVLAQMCDAEGLFRACGDWLARLSGGRARALLALVFVVAAVTTAVLSLDATVVLLTPVVFATAARAGARPRPHVYACTHLANSASLLLPVSNLTYAGSLGTMLWRRVTRAHGSGPSLAEFTRLGLLTVPAALAAAVLCLWAMLHVIGT